MNYITENGTPQAPPATPSFLSAATRLGKVGLIVSNLQRSIEFYSGVIGLQILARSEGFVQLGIAAENRILLDLEQRDGVYALTGKRLGLYHFALLLPSRADLSSFAEHLHASGVRAGMSDHLVSEAFYLEDPDGLQIEVYADRDQEDWLWNGDEIAVATQPLNPSQATGSAAPHLGGNSTRRHNRPHSPLHWRRTACGAAISPWAGHERAFSKLPRSAVPRSRRLPPSHRSEHMGRERASGFGDGCTIVDLGTSGATG